MSPAMSKKALTRDPYLKRGRLNIHTGTHPLKKPQVSPVSIKKNPQDSLFKSILFVIALMAVSVALMAFHSCSSQPTATATSPSGLVQNSTSAPFYLDAADEYQPRNNDL